MITPAQALLVPNAPKQAIIDYVDSVLAAEFTNGSTVTLSIHGSIKVVESVITDYEAAGWTVVQVPDTNDYQFSET